MEKDCLGVVAAMPEEIAPLLRRVPQYRKENGGNGKLYRFELSGHPVVLAQSGMGPKHAAEATDRLIAAAAPKAILNFGFGGGVLPGIGVGELVLAERVLFLENGRFSETALPDSELSRAVAAACGNAGISVKKGTFITAAAIMNKKEVAGSLPEELRHPVLEMETAAVLNVASRAGIPVVAVRGISDAADEELGFSLEEFCDPQLNISIPRVLGCVARKPWIIPQLMRLSGNTKRAGKELALCVEEAVKGLGARG